MGEGKQCLEKEALPCPAWFPPPPGTNVGERAEGGSQGVTGRLCQLGGQCAG